MQKVSKLVGQKLQSRFRYIQENLPTEYCYFTTEGKASKSTNGYFSSSPSYDTIPVSGDLTRVFAALSDRQNIYQLKQDQRFKQTRIGETVTFQSDSIAFKFFYGESVESTSVIVSTHRKGTNYPLKDSSAQYTVDQISEGLKLVMSKVSGTKMLQMLVDIFIDNPQDHLSDYDDSAEADNAVALSNFQMLAEKATESFCSRNMSALDGDTLIGNYRDEVTAAKEATNEFKKVQEIEKQLKLAREALHAKHKQIIKTLSKKHKTATEILDWRKEGDESLRVALEGLFKVYQATPDGIKPQADKILMNQSFKLLSAYKSYSGSEPSRYLIRYLTQTYKVNPQLIGLSTG